MSQNANDVKKDCNKQSILIVLLGKLGDPTAAFKEEYNQIDGCCTTRYRLQ